MGRWALLTLLPLGVVWAAVAANFGLNAAIPVAHLSAFVAVGITYIVAGVVGWGLRPGNRSGQLLTAIGFAWFISLFGAAPEPWRTLARPFSDLYNVFAVWLFLAYPTGFLGSRGHRLTVAGTALVLFVLDAGTLFGLSVELVAASGIVIPLLVVALIIRRWLRSTPPARRVLWPVLLAGAITLLAVVLVQIPRLARAPSETIELARFVRTVVQGTVPIAFLLGLLRLRMARSAVGDLVVNLGDAPAPEHLRDQLTKALGDPSITVLRWSPTGRAFVDEAGRSVELPRDDPQRAVTLLEGKRGTLAALVHDPALLQDPSLVGSVSAALRLAVENERLHEEVRAQLEEVRASRARIVAAGDAERRRVERDLHDGAQQQLLSVSLRLRLARSRTRDDPELDRALAATADELKVAIGELRELARGIHPAILTEAGLGPALQSLADRSPVPVDLDVSLAARLPQAAEAAAYFLVSEALANVAKHAEATKVEVRADSSGGSLRIEVADDGVGGADGLGGSGLRGISDRVAAVGGRLEVDSPSGGGTRVTAEIPCA